MKDRQMSSWTGLSFSTIQYDLPAGLVVFLVALPLCLGIALASGAPLFSGLITGMVGGIIVSVVSGGQLNVSGPAAGLTVIVLAAITAIGSYQGFLLAVVLAGVLQLILGFLKAGTIGNYFPTSVIKGMLAAIGVILIIKQIPHAVGYDKDFVGDFTFIEVNDENSFTSVLHALNKISPGALIISLSSLAVMIGWDKLRWKSIKSIPAPLVVVVLGIVLNLLFESGVPDLALRENHLVAIPAAGSIGEFFTFFTLPDLSYLGHPQVYKTAFTIAIIGSIETLLSIEAVDKLDPMKRHTPTSHELKAQGAGNIIAGLLGGLPMTAVIVRGAANVNAGAKSKASAFFHGCFLLLAAVCIPHVINLIPYASLAVILLVTGYKLTRVSLYKQMYRAGNDQFYPFVITVMAIVFTDLLTGIAIGLAIGVFIILKRNMENTYSFSKHSYEPGKPIHIILSEEVSFLNKAGILMTLNSLPSHSTVIIDGTKSAYIDYDVLEVIAHFKERAAHKQIDLELRGIKTIYKIAQH